MAYIGAEPLTGQNREVDDISGSFNGSTTAFTLQVSSVNVSPESANNILISLGGVIQNPGTDYTIAASTITFTTAPASGLDFFGLILGAGINTATVADSTITGAKVSYPLTLAGAVGVTGKLTAASGILFGSDTADANRIQDYEEGTWTPTVVSAGTIGTPQFTCTYTKIGRLVTINADIAHLSDTTSSTFIKIGGLPYVPPSTSGKEHSAVCHGERYGGEDIIVAYLLYNSGSWGISFRFGVPTNHFSGVRHSDISDSGEDNNLRFTLTYELV